MPNLYTYTRMLYGFAPHELALYLDKPFLISVPFLRTFVLAPYDVHKVQRDIGRRFRNEREDPGSRSTP